jgi:hypothetical protein
MQKKVEDRRQKIENRAESVSILDLLLSSILDLFPVFRVSPYS